MKKIIFYSHDTYGLGNIRRTMSICQSLMASIPDLSILVITGSPMIQSFRIPEGMDYVKLPCLTRTEQDGYASKFLDEEAQHLFKLRSDIILCTVANFKPDLVMVDKKPYGVQNELIPMLSYMEEHLPHAKLSLILRDILDSPEVTRTIWKRHGFFEAIEKYYDEIGILGTPEVFDPRKEYGFSSSMKEKTRFWGYIRREPGLKSRAFLRNEMGIQSDESLVLVTAGGGEDGSQLFESYLKAQEQLTPHQRHKTLMILGPDMSTSTRSQLHRWAGQYAKIHTVDFTDDLMSYMDASDLVISMGGYGTMCEILTLNKRAIVIPRVKPVLEQWIRTSRMVELGLVNMIHPDTLTAPTLTKAIQDNLDVPGTPLPLSCSLSLNALSHITKSVSSLLSRPKETTSEATFLPPRWPSGTVFSNALIRAVV